MSSIDMETNEGFQEIVVVSSSQKCSIHCYEVLKQRMPTKSNLQRKGIIHSNDDINCALCGEEEEDIPHVLFRCKFAYQIWSSCYTWLGQLMAAQSESILHLLQHTKMLWKGPNRYTVVTFWASII
ncbi:hypothetical protein ACS0TY_019205 [Phlomoides rotata]